MTLHANPDTVRAWRARSKPLERGSGPQRRTEMPSVKLAVVDGSGAPVIPLPTSRRNATGFPRPVKLAIRTRAGNGDLDEACCEACGRWLGRYGGQCQHRDARGLGGTSLPLTDSAANGVLLCGTPSTGCHGLCERRDARMNRRGFWLKHGQAPDETPILLHRAHGSAIARWLTEDGKYSTEPPGGAA